MKKHFRLYFQVGSLILLIILLWAATHNAVFWWLVAIILPVIGIGWYDSLQQQDNTRRNYPVLGTFKKVYVTERHLFVQDFQETGTEGKPFSWLQRKIVYARAEDKLTSAPFGTELEYSAPGHTWWLHSSCPVPILKEDLRIKIGNSACKQPYEASILNVSGMSYGSISKNATLALGYGAKLGGFALNTGEGGLAQWHLSPECDLIFQFGTGYFGCRTKDGNFDPVKFEEVASQPAVKMIEIKISQGAKPGYGAILPASKNTTEISAIRGLPPHETIHSPGGHTAFSTSVELLEFVQQLRELSGGKPVGFKLCMGLKHEFVAICKAMIQTNIKPDFITIDGGEGGSGAANFDSINFVGSPIELSLVFAHDILTGFNLRKDVKLIGSGKIISAFDIVRFIALGADAVYSARAMMFALGCEQAMKCNTNECPTGVTTMEPDLVRGLVVNDKKVKVANFHRNTINGVKELMAASGLRNMREISRSQICLRVDQVKEMTLGELYPNLQPGILLREPFPEQFDKLIRMADANTFQPVRKDI